MLLHRPVLTSAILLVAMAGMVLSGGDATRLWTYLLAAASFIAYLGVSYVWMHEFALEATRLIDTKDHIELKIFPPALGVLSVVFVLKPVLELSPLWQGVFDTLGIGLIMVFYGMCAYCAGLAKALGARRGLKIELTGVIVYLFFLPLCAGQLSALGRRLGFPDRTHPVVG